ncbi:MAG: tetratricopeptide repeat protein, partial [Muribaculaceae bacterium]|nr:tetratricopeptide repeat protein [Muribaculaceae bacterium]
ILYSQRDYSQAAECFSKAIELDPEFGPAYYNRGLCALSAGKKNEAFADLSRAGELGVLPSYNILKRMK